ncbi:hypothetical protein ACSX1C_00320 [Pseudomonas sp. MBLB4123]|uniref:hypothetical protein n=1 Tax=Pseudomonas sp. MBLB4123 TaxID=3451557 RepID=UPI003F74F334
MNEHNTERCRIVLSVATAEKIRQQMAETGKSWNKTIAAILADHFVHQELRKLLNEKEGN